MEMIADKHHGEVPLHGRLFSQWLHYVFPQECPYPQLTNEAGLHLVSKEYKNATGKQSMMSRAA